MGRRLGAIGWQPPGVGYQQAIAGVGPEGRDEPGLVVQATGADGCGQAGVVRHPQGRQPGLVGLLLGWAELQLPRHTSRARTAMRTW